jgi:hypothetical protein
MSLLLDRVTLTDSEQVLLSTGPELWFVESGSMTIEVTNGPAHSLAMGESVMIENSEPLTPRFAPEGCASALRVRTAAAVGMIADSEVEGPAMRSADSCPPSQVLVDVPFVAGPAMPAELLLARLSIDSAGFLAATAFPGPVALAVESGDIRVSIEGVIDGVLEPGSWVAVEAGTPVSLSPYTLEPASVLLIGAVPLAPSSGTTHPGGTQTEPPDHTSALFGYTLSWDESWSVSEQTSTATSERLALSNGVSDLYIEAFADYGEPATTCIEGMLGTLTRDPGFSNIRDLASSGPPVVSGDDSRATATIALTYQGEGFSGEYAEHLDCRVIVPGESVLLVTHFAPLDQYAAEQAAVEAILATLAFPE